MAKRAPGDIVNLKLRLPERLRAQLERAARKGDRSLNSEIISRVEESFTRHKMVDEITSALRAQLVEDFRIEEITSATKDHSKQYDEWARAVLSTAKRQADAKTRAVLHEIGNLLHKLAMDT